MRSRLVTFLSLLFFCQYLPAQKIVPAGMRGTGYFMGKEFMDAIDSVVLRIQYITTFRECKEDGIPNKCVEALLIGENMSEYCENVIQYSNELIPIELHAASSRSKDTAVIVTSMLLNTCNKYKLTPYTVWKNYPKQGWQTCFQNLSDELMITDANVCPQLYYEEASSQPEWEIMEGDSIICGYVCQRASTIFRGRTWKVWYAPELPYQDGPWKLCGLPGLILKAEDAAGDFCFEAIGIKRPHDEYIGKHPNLASYTKATPMRIQELQELKYKNPNGFYSMIMGEKMFEMVMNMNLIPNSRGARTPCLLEKFE